VRGEARDGSQCNMHFVAAAMCAHRLGRLACTMLCFCFKVTVSFALMLRVRVLLERMRQQKQSTWGHWS